jgi:hypothetical protein
MTAMVRRWAWIVPCAICAQQLVAQAPDPEADGRAVYEIPTAVKRISDARKREEATRLLLSGQ